MTDGEVLLLAEQYLELYRALLKVDPIIKLSVYSREQQEMSLCEKDQTSSLSWKLSLDASRHTSLKDIRYSVVEFVISVLLSELDMVNDRNIDELRGRVRTRLTLAIEPLLPDPEISDEE